MAIGFHGESITAAHVKRGTSAKPEVELAFSYKFGNESQAAVMERLAKELQLARYHCTTLLSNGEYQLLSVDAPNVPPDELKTAIRWRLKDMLDFHVDDATIDVLDVPVEKNASGRTHSMYAVAARNQLIEQRQSLFLDVKIPLTVIDIPEMAQRNISALLEPEGRGVAMLSLDTDGGLLTVSCSGELYLSRRIDIPLAQLTQSDPDRRAATFERITLELQRSLDHFDRQYHFITLSKLVLAPVPGDVGGLMEYLGSNLYTPVERLDLESILDLAKVPDLRNAESQNRFFMTLGAALRHEEKSL